MFLNLAQLFVNAGKAPESVFLVHPVQLSRWLEEAWAGAAAVPVLPGASGKPFLGDPDIVGALDLPTQASPFIAPSGVDPADPGNWTGKIGPQQAPGATGLIWHHLMYAYLVESTGVIEIFAETVRRLVVGETLGPLSTDGTQWLRATEELFFREPPLFSISGVTSELRPHARVNRRNAYWRMFAFDLPHAIPAGRPGAGDAGWKKDVGSGSNGDFRAKWTELLRQVWLGLENRSNQSGANATDPSYVALLCSALRDMMNNRRRGGQLAREEFAYVTQLSWFDLTLRIDKAAIIRDLNCEASSADGRLAKVAGRVGMSSAARTRELLLLAEPVSAVLRAIELGLFDTPPQAAALFTGNTALTRAMNDIINLWQSATGDRVKDRPAPAVRDAGAQPLRIPTPAGASGNGSGG